ncbi:acetyl-CoA synthetase-like protein [Karstenula rhodostoma CBS 690.94]|uniref:Acetyl-CoA synthetase-like protein n=1 Tax=Karstenula rhodostoma CBS 690.94 TaxID=1392251 RepID=A0A9P4Q0C1_9PLEO|nr:acetyl-CoA synthetase-like protein [Karstenula rhodostoma CBS 690.94]
MVLKSRWSFDIPQVSLPTYLFDSPTADLPKTPALISAKYPEKYYISVHTYRLYAQRLAVGLLRAGLQPGERVLLFSGNTLFFPTVMMGIIMAGGIYTGANPTYVARELAYQLKDSGAKYLLCAEGSLDTGIAAAQEAGLPASSVFVFDDGVATFEGRTVENHAPALGGTIRHWTTLLASEADGRAYAWPDLRTPAELDTVVALNYSSGTTGLAKGVMITHANYVANSAQQMWMSTMAADYAQRRPSIKHLCFLPMYHAMAQALFCVNATKMRLPVYVMPKFDFIEMLQYIQKYQITDLVLVPPVIVAMAKHPAVQNFDLSSVVKVGSGAAPLGREIAEEFEKLWPDRRVNVKQGWGMTELTCAATTADPDKVSRNGAVGELLPNCEAKLVLDDEGKVEAPRGERGEIWIRAPNVMKGYWGKPEATRETLTPDGWLKTGDVAYIDEDNEIHVVDRKKELIKVKGLQVAPAELEALLLDHPSVQDVAVIGITLNDEELPRAYIVPRTPSQATPQVADAIKTWLAERVSRAKRLDGGVVFMEAIPKNPSGKILRKELREMAKAEAEAAGVKAKL